MCSMHGACPENAYAWGRWIRPMRDGTNLTVLQDTKEADFFKQVGGSVQFHDDLAVYNRCGKLVFHLCSYGPMGSCRQTRPATFKESSLLTPEGYTNLRDAMLAAARPEHSGCNCSQGAGPSRAVRNQLRLPSTSAEPTSSRHGETFPLVLSVGVVVILVGVTMCLFRACRSNRIEATTKGPEASTYGCPE